MTTNDDNWQEGTQTFRTYLLRCWLEENNVGDSPRDKTTAWRFTLSQLGNERDRRGFSCLDDLVGYLADQLVTFDGEA